ncbi:MAG: DUF2062 domain-containing protein, partial [Hymenobacteraceae bacterium]|nr:DUF2062 domain-containing protein [Hymenobacteraceae bacterium]
DLLKQGLTPEKLSMTVARGAVVGLIPVFGVTTVVSTLLALRLRLNVAGTVLVSYIVHPLQLLLLVPFIKAGGYLSGGSAIKFTVAGMMRMLKTDWLTALQKLWLANLLGVVVWLVVAIPLAFLIYYITLPIFRKYVAKQLV